MSESDLVKIKNEKLRGKKAAFCVQMSSKRSLFFNTLHNCPFFRTLMWIRLKTVTWQKALGGKTAGKSANFSSDSQQPPHVSMLVLKPHLVLSYSAQTKQRRAAATWVRSCSRSGLGVNEPCVMGRPRPSGRIARLGSKAKQMLSRGDGRVMKGR